MISNALTKEPDFFSFPPLCKTDVCFATYRMRILSAVTRNLFCHLPHANFECGHWKSCIVFPLCGLCLFDKNLEKYLQNCRAGRHTICAPLRLYFRISEARHGVTFFTVRDGAMTWLVYVLNALYNIFVFFYHSTTFYRKENSICTNLEWGQEK